MARYEVGGRVINRNGFRGTVIRRNENEFEMVICRIKWDDGLVSSMFEELSDGILRRLSILEDLAWCADGPS